MSILFPNSGRNFDTRLPENVVSSTLKITDYPNFRLSANEFHVPAQISVLKYKHVRIIDAQSASEMPVHGSDRKSCGWHHLHTNSSLLSQLLICPSNVHNKSYFRKSCWENACVLTTSLTNSKFCQWKL